VKIFLSQGLAPKPLIMVKSLWEEASDGVSPKWQSQLVALADKACNRTVILGKVVEKQKICRDKQWKVYKPNGHKVCIRDILEKVAFWLAKVKTIGDLICSFDPLHASLPCAGAQFLLTVSRWRYLSIWAC
jgi:hypothetical protein